MCESASKEDHLQSIVYIISQHIDANYIQSLIELLTHNKIQYHYQKQYDGLKVPLDRRYFVVVDNHDGPKSLGKWFNSLLLFIVGYPLIGKNLKNHYCDNPSQIIQKYYEFRSLPQYISKHYLSSSVIESSYLKSSNLSSNKRNSLLSQNGHKKQIKQFKADIHSKLFLYISQKNDKFNKWILKIAANNVKKFQLIDSIQNLTLTLSVCRSQNNFLLVAFEQFHKIIDKAFEGLQYLLYNEDIQQEQHPSIVKVCKSNCQIIDTIRGLGFQVVSLKDIDKSIVKYDNPFANQAKTKTKKKLLWRNQNEAQPNIQKTTKYSQSKNINNFSELKENGQKEEKQNGSEKQEVRITITNQNSQKDNYYNKSMIMSNGTACVSKMSIQLEIPHTKQQCMNPKSDQYYALQKQTIAKKPNKSIKRVKRVKSLKPKKQSEQNSNKQNKIIKLQKQFMEQIKKISKQCFSEQQCDKLMGQQNFNSLYCKAFNGFDSAIENCFSSKNKSAKAITIYENKQSKQNVKIVSHNNSNLQKNRTCQTKSCSQQNCNKLSANPKLVKYRKQIIGVEKSEICEIKRQSIKMSKYSFAYNQNPFDRKDCILYWKDFNFQIENNRNFIIQKIKANVFQNKSFYTSSELDQMIKKEKKKNIILMTDQTGFENLINTLLKWLNSKNVISIYVFKKQSTNQQLFISYLKEVLKIKDFSHLKRIVKPVIYNEYIDQSLQAAKEIIEYFKFYNNV